MSKQFLIQQQVIACNCRASVIFAVCICFILWYLVYLYSATLCRISMPALHINFPWLRRTCSFQYHLNHFLGSIQPCCHHGAGNCSNTRKQSLSNQVPIHSWVEKVHMQVKCLAQGHSAKPLQPRPVPKAFQSKSQATVFISVRFPRTVFRVMLPS